MRRSLVFALTLLVVATGASAQTPAPTLPAPGGPAQPPPPTVRKVEIYGNVTGTTLDKKSAVVSVTVLQLVVTSQTSVPVGSEGVMFRKVQAAGKAAWIQIAKVKLKKLDAGGKVQLDVVELTPEPPSAKKVNAFAKNTNVKVQFTL